MARFEKRQELVAVASRRLGVALLVRASYAGTVTSSVTSKDDLAASNEP